MLLDPSSTQLKNKLYKCSDGHIAHSLARYSWNCIVATTRGLDKSQPSCPF